MAEDDAICLPVLVAGIAFAINETFDRILLEKILPENIAKAEVGVYSACYKLAIVHDAFCHGLPAGYRAIFFQPCQKRKCHANLCHDNQIFCHIWFGYITCVVVFSDLLKSCMIRKPGYWEGMKVVPLIILANFFLGIYHNLSVWYKLSDKTKMGAYISIVGAIVTLSP